MIKRTITLFLILSVGLIPVLVSGAGSSGAKNNSNQKTFKPLCTPSPSPEAVALFNYIQDMYGKKILSGQMYAPWGVNEMEYVRETTGKLPAIKGVDLIDEKENAKEVRRVIEWWKAGGIPTVMWHWGAPSIGEGYENSKKQIDINKIFQEGTPENLSFWTELKKKADYLETIRDANVPILWRPFHELNGNWFWWGKQGPELFKKLWITMYDYMVKERKLNNMIWVLCYMDNPDGAWNPGREYWDIAGADTYKGGATPHLQMYNEVKKIIGDDITPITYHECGIPPDPDSCFSSGAMWSWWMEWHTSMVTRIDKEYLKKVYNHELIITFDELPNIMSVYGLKGKSQASGKKAKSKIRSFSDLIFTDIGSKTKPGTVVFGKDKTEMLAGGADIWGTNDEFNFGYTKIKGNFDISVQILSLSKANLYTKAGLMARADLSNNSQHVYFQVFPDNSPRNNNNGGCEFQYRAEKAAEMKAIYPDKEKAGTQFNVNFPNTWIRLKRSGDVFESYFSSDNKKWVLYSTFTLKLPDELFVGLAVTSHNSTEYTTAGFASLKVKN